MDSKEADIYLETSEEQLKDAELAFREGRYALCAFLSASSAENGTSAMLLALGAKPSKKHRNSLVIHRLALSAAPKTRSILTEIIESMKNLEPHITKARYPILKGSDLMPPSGFYTKAIAQKILAEAHKVLKRVKNLVKDLN